MVRPSQERQTVALTDAQSLAIGDGTEDGEDVDLDGGGTGGDGGGIISPPVSHVLEVIDGGSPIDLDFNVADWWDITIDQDTTFTFSNPPASGSVGILYIIIRQGTGAPWTVTWPAEVVWDDLDGLPLGTAPTLHTDEDAVNRVDILTEDGGATYGGSDESATAGGGGTSVEVDEDGASVVGTASVIDFRHGLDVTAPGGGVARVAVDETELVLESLSSTDITTGNASTSKHGLLKKLDNNSAHFMDGTGAWSTPPDVGFADPMTTRGDMIYRGGSGTTRRAVGSSGQDLTSNGTDPTWADHVGTIGFEIGDGTVVITATGPKAIIGPVPYACTVTQWTAIEVGAISTSSTFDIKKRAIGGGAATSMVGAGTKPTITASTEGQAAPASWTSTALAAGDMVEIHVATNNNGKQFTVALKIART